MVKTTIAPLAETTPPDPAALPAEWAQWAEEPGHAVTISEEGRVLGTLHVTVVGRTEGWLEGLWVQPSARGRGVGRRLVQEAEELLRGHGVTAVRTAVPARDYAALAVAEHAGFIRHSEAVVLMATIDLGPINIAYDAQVEPASLRDVPAIVRLINESPRLGAWRGLVPLGWRFRTLQPELLKGLINDGRIVRSGERVEGAAAFAINSTAGVITFLEGPRAHHQALFGAVAERARATGATRIALFTPEREPPPGLHAGFAPHPWCPDGLVIVEKLLGGAPTSSPAPTRQRH